jgi:hypothetical protein
MESLSKPTDSSEGLQEEERDYHSRVLSVFVVLLCFEITKSVQCSRKWHDSIPSVYCPFSNSCLKTHHTDSMKVGSIVYSMHY